MAVYFKGAHFPTESMLTGVRWSVASLLSTRHTEERMQERGVSVGHAPVTRWVVTYSPQLERRSTAASGPGGAVGGWTRPISASRATGLTSIAPWVKPANPSMSCAPSTGMSAPPCAFPRRRSAVMAGLQRSRSTAARPMPSPFGAIMPGTAPRS
jgi:hypothetical protein